MIWENTSQRKVCINSWAYYIHSNAWTVCINSLFHQLSELAVPAIDLARCIACYVILVWLTYIYILDWEVRWSFLTPSLTSIFKTNEITSRSLGSLGSFERLWTRCMYRSTTVDSHGSWNCDLGGGRASKGCSHCSKMLPLWGCLPQFFQPGCWTV